MPIPFRDADELAELGPAGYLTIIPRAEGDRYEGALFLINARGEPLEFTYNRVEMPHSFLWRKDDIRRHAQRRLTSSLLSICPIVPRLILCLAEEVSSELFCEDISVAIPVCRVSPVALVTSFAGQEIQEAPVSPEPINLFWYPKMPEQSTPERQLVDEIIRRELIQEPFNRAKSGLDEVYRSDQGLQK